MRRREVFSGRLRTGLLLAPGLAPLVAVAALHPGADAGYMARAVAWTLQAFGGVYLAACLLLTARGRSLAKVVLAGWATVLAAAVAYVVYGVWAPPPRMQLREPRVGERASAAAASKPARPRKPDWRVEADGHPDKEWARRYYEEWLDANHAHWQPYVYWRRAAYEGRDIRIDGEGRRRTFTPAGLAADAPRLWVFGGSTAWGTGASDDETIPSWLARKLERAGSPARVANFGEGGYVSTQGLLRLLLELRVGNVPDVVVFYDGVNDLAAATQTGEPGIPQNESRRREDFLGGTGAPPPPPPELTPQQLATASVAIYAANLRLLQTLSREYGFALCCFWQPVAYLHKPLTDWEQRALERLDLGESMRLGYDAVAAMSLGPCFEDLRRVFERTDAPRYVDWCHLTGAGNEDVAEAMMPRVLAALRSR